MGYREGAALRESELTVLAGLLREVMRVDGAARADEVVFLRQVAAELEELDDAWARADLELRSSHAVREAAKRIKRPFAQEQMYAAVEHVARAGSIRATEEVFLRWLRAEWGLAPAGLGEEE